MKIKSSDSILDILSNDEFQKIIDKLDFVYFERSYTVGEKASIDEVKEKSIIFYWILQSLQRFTLGNFSYTYYHDSLERTGPTIKRKPKSQFQVIKRLIQ